MQQKRIYLDNGATTKVDEEVLHSMSEYFSREYGNASSLHAYGRNAKQAIEAARKIIAESINAEPDEIIFTSGGTESDNLAIRGVLENSPAEKRHIITTNIEHPALLNLCKQLESEGVPVTYLKVDEFGLVSIEALKKSIRKDTVLVSVMHSNNEIGTLQPIKDIGAICKEHGIIFHTDAVQSYTKEKIDVKSMHIDLMSLSAHKVHGPKGVGVLYKKKSVTLKPMLYGGSHEFGLRPGTENVPGIIGFGKAVEIAQKVDVEKIKALRNKLISGLSEIPESILNGHPKNRLVNNVNYCFKYIEGESLILHLDNKGIAASTGSACSSHSLEPSHVLLAIGRPPEIAHGSIRLTLSKYNTPEEIEYTIKCIKDTVAKLRKMSPLWKEGA